MATEHAGRTRATQVLLPTGVAILAGALLGAAIRLGAAEALPEERGSAAAICAFALAVCLAPAIRGPGLTRSLAALVGGAGMAAAAVLAAGGSGSVGASAVTAGAALLSVGVCASAARWATLAPAAPLVGALGPLALAALAFVADPWIEPRGSGPESPSRAALVYRLSPLAAITSPEGGTGVDWQTRSLLYDGGPEGGGGGLSVIGQFYPSRPAGPLAWGAAAFVLGAVLTGLGSFRTTTPDTL